MTKRLKQVKLIAQNPDYRGQEIYLLVNDEEETDYCGDSSEDSEPITVVLDTITKLGTSALKITFKGNSASANFHIVTVAFPLPERRPWQE